MRESIICPRSSIVSEAIPKLSQSAGVRQLHKKAGSQFPISRFNFSEMEKPSARGPSPSRKAHHALGQGLNRKSKRPPRVPAKKIANGWIGPPIVKRNGHA